MAESTGNFDTNTMLYYQWPVEEIIKISAPFGENRGGRWHLGIDIVAPIGSYIYAAASGIISFVGIAGDLGWCVKIDHTTDPYSSWYGHMEFKTLKGVTKGEYISIGDPIGIQGSTGASTGPHLHFQINAFQSDDPGMFPKYRGVPIGNSNCLDPMFILSQGQDSSVNYSGAYGKGNVESGNIPYGSNGKYAAVTISGSYNANAVSMLDLFSGGPKLLEPSNDERKYGLSVYDTVQPLIRKTTAGAVGRPGDVFDALSRYAKYIYYYLNSSISVATVNLLSMPWLRPGFNTWLDPLFLDRIYYINSVQHQGNKQTGVFTTIGLMFGRNRKKFQAGKYEFGSFKPGDPDNVFINKVLVGPSAFSKNLVASAADFDAIAKRTSDYYSDGAVQPQVEKAAFNSYYQYLYNTINTEAGTVSGAYQAPAIGAAANMVNDVLEKESITVTRDITRFDGTFKRNDIVVATGLAYRTSKGKGPAVQLNGVQGALTVTDSGSSDPYPYYFANRGWMAKSSLQFASREETVTETITKYVSPAATQEFDSVAEIQKWLDAKYEKAPQVIKDRIARHNKIKTAADIYIARHYVKEPEK